MRVNCNIFQYEKIIIKHVAGEVELKKNYFLLLSQTFYTYVSAERRYYLGL